MDRPSVTDRCSSSEWSGSSMVRENVSSNAVQASSKETPCFRTFVFALAGSHSKPMSMKSELQSIVQLSFKARSAAAILLFHIDVVRHHVNLDRGRAGRPSASPPVRLVHPLRTTTSCGTPGFSERRSSEGGASRCGSAEAGKPGWELVSARLKPCPPVLQIFRATNLPSDICHPPGRRARLASR